MGSPPTPDLAKTLDGLLTGLDKLLAERDRQVAEGTEAIAEASPTSNHYPGVLNRPVAPPDFSAFAEADQLLSFMTILGLASVAPLGPAGAGQSAIERLRTLLSQRATQYGDEDGQPVGLSPRWETLMKRLPPGVFLRSDEDPGFAQLVFTSKRQSLTPEISSPDQVLAHLRDLAGPVGQTLLWFTPPRQAPVVRLPVFPELGGCIVAESKGYAVARWAAHGPLALFFWLDEPLLHYPDFTGLALVPPGQVVTTIAN